MINNEPVEVGSPLAFGTRSTVYASAIGTVLKVPNRDTPSSWMKAEAAYCDAATAAGVAAPRVLNSVMIDGVLAVQFERIAGLSLWDNVGADPTKAREAGVTLAQIQVGLRTVPVPIVFPETRSRLLAKLHNAKGPLGPLFEPAMNLLDSLGRLDARFALNHGDLHPKNVLLAESGPVLVDWFDASRGPWIADVARTSLLLDTGLGADNPSPGWLADLAQSYASHIAQDPWFDDAVFRRWRVVCAAARMAEGLQLDFTRDLLRRELDALPEWK